MADYPIEGGPFLNACKKLLTRDYSISWYDRFPPAAIVQAGQHSHGLEMELPASLLSVASSETAQFDFATSNPAENKSNRSKYACQACGYNVWGKPALKGHARRKDARILAYQEPDLSPQRNAG